MSQDLKAKLAQLKDLHGLGLLTDAAYEQQQAALVATAMGTTPSPAGTDPLVGQTRTDAPSPPVMRLQPAQVGG